MPKQQVSKNGRGRLLLIGFLTLLALLVSWILLQLTNVDPNMSFPLMLVFGVIDLVLFLTIAANILNYCGLSSKEEALGLPKGSVRALIALSLIIIFAIMAVYMQMQLSDSPLKDATGEYVRDANGTVIWFQPSQDKKDFSLQVLTTISTLVVAVAGFYFGTRAGEGNRREAPTPSLEITPESPTELNLSINKELDPIKATTTPANESVDFKIDSADNGEIIRKTKANEFRYKPKDQLIKQVMATGEKKEVTLNFWLTNNPKTSALVVVEIISGTQPAPQPQPPTAPTLKITDPGDSVDMKQGETKTIVLEAAPSDKKIVCKEYDKTKVESVEEDPNKKGTFKIKVKTGAQSDESTTVTFKLEDSDVEAPFTINVKAKQ